MEQIRRYSNRKCYSSSEKKFVTYKEIFDMIGNGRVVQIVDHNTNADITSRILGKLVGYRNLSAKDLTGILSNTTTNGVT